MKIRVDKADVAFSLYIRTKADFTCEYCGRKGRTECSHFHGRRKASTRYDEENVACLCSGCHSYLGEHPKKHDAWFKKRLGSERYELLNIRAETIIKVDRTKISKEYKDKLQNL